MTFDIHPSRLAFYDENMQFVVEPGLFRFSVGASSVNLRQQAVAEITGPVAKYSQRSVVAVVARVGGPGNACHTPDRSAPWGAWPPRHRGDSVLTAVVSDAGPANPRAGACERNHKT